jgi:hypothetical protein
MKFIPDSPSILKIGLLSTTVEKVSTQANSLLGQLPPITPSHQNQQQENSKPTSNLGQEELLQQGIVWSLQTTTVEQLFNSKYVMQTIPLFLK